jgi:hypothetical protein
LGLAKLDTTIVTERSSSSSKTNHVGWDTKWWLTNASWLTERTTHARQKQILRKITLPKSLKLNATIISEDWQGCWDEKYELKFKSRLKRAENEVWARNGSDSSEAVSFQ